MIWLKLIFGGFGRRGVEAAVAGAVLAIATAVLASSLMVIRGANDALAQAEQVDRPDLVQIKGRFNRALFETPRSGNLPPLTLPVYEPLIDPEQLNSAISGDGLVIPRQSFLRNIVAGDTFLNVYIYGIEPGLETQVSDFSVARGRLLRSDDGAVAVLDTASAQALGVDLSGTFSVRKADGEDLDLTVVGILGALDFRDPPPRTVEAPTLAADSSFVSTGIFVTLHTSEEIFDRSTLTDAIVVARRPADAPSLADSLREAFRLEPGVFITERYGQFSRKVGDFVMTLALFAVIGGTTSLLAGAFAGNLLHDIYADRRRQYATLIAVGFSPGLDILPAIAFGLVLAVLTSLVGSALAFTFAPSRFAMPSLMADLGSIVPSFDPAILGVVFMVTAIATAMGFSPTAWRLYHNPIANTLASEAP